MVAFLLIVAILFTKLMLNIVKTPQNNTNKTDSNDMNEGDYHSGPGGYTPNSGYQETHYGEIFDDEEDEHHH